MPGGGWGSRGSFWGQDVTHGGRGWRLPGLGLPTPWCWCQGFVLGAGLESRVPHLEWLEGARGPGADSVTQHWGWSGGVRGSQCAHPNSVMLHRPSATKGEI